jgi:uroporphyrinogen-III synthase
MAKQAREQGLVPWQMPVMDIFWLLPDKAGLHALNNAKVIIVTSRHALTSLRKASIDLPVESIWIAIGQATANALNERGIKSQVPEQTDSEGLLEHIISQTDNAQSLVILKGEGGRTLLAEKLQARGVQVSELALYRRICKPCEEGMIDTFLKQNNAVISVASGETLTCALKSATVAQRQHLILRPLVVISERVAQFARDKGWRGEIIVATEASSAGLIEAAKQVRF